MARLNQEPAEGAADGFGNAVILELAVNRPETSAQGPEPDYQRVWEGIDTIDSAWNSRPATTVPGEFGPTTWFGDFYNGRLLQQENYPSGSLLGARPRTLAGWLKALSFQYLTAIR